jgi:hypothetical protein
VIKTDIIKAIRFSYLSYHINPFFAKDHYLDISLSEVDNPADSKKLHKYGKFVDSMVYSNRFTGRISD